MSAPEWSLPMNRAELIARVEALKAALRTANAALKAVWIETGKGLEGLKRTEVALGLVPETAEPVKGAGQHCFLCNNEHDLMSACPPKETPSPQHFADSIDVAESFAQETGEKDA